MAYVTRQTSQTVSKGTDHDEIVERPVAVRQETAAAPTAARVIYLIGGIVISLLSFRFLLSLLGANRENAFASFIYSVSYPFVAPFFGLFNYQQQFGVSRFEYETLIAILFWSFVTWGLVRLVSLGRRGGTGV